MSTKVLDTIVEYLTSGKVTILSNYEIYYLSLLETIAELEDNQLLKKFAEKFKQNRIHLYGRARSDLVRVAESYRVKVYSEEKAKVQGLARVDSALIKKLLRGELEF